MRERSISWHNVNNVTTATSNNKAVAAAIIAVAGKPVRARR